MKIIYLTFLFKNTLHLASLNRQQIAICIMHLPLKTDNSVTGYACVKLLKILSVKTNN